MKLEEIFTPVRCELAAVEQRLRGFVHSENQVISALLAKMIEVGGKRLRPALVLTAAKACSSLNKGSSGAEPLVTERAVRLASAVEMIHMASLIHDDVIDNAGLRRGVPSINVELGSKLAVLAGDHLYSKAVSLLAEDGNAQVLRNVAATAQQMTHGELTEILSRNDVTLTEAKYLAIIAGKTASLISCSCRLGAMLALASGGQVDMLAEYGRNLGMAFQVTDDLLDIAGREAGLGKHPGNDIREGSLTLPVIQALSVATQEDRQWMTDTLRSGQVSDEALARMQSMVETYGGMAYSLEKARQYGRACKLGLESLDKSASRTSLAMLADYVVARVRSN